MNVVHSNHVAVEGSIEIDCISRVGSYGLR